MHGNEPINCVVEWLQQVPFTWTLTPSDLYQQLVPLPILWWQLKSVLSVTTTLAQLIYNIPLSQYCQAIDLSYAAMALLVT